jgi:hypothetical protein
MVGDEDGAEGQVCDSMPLNDCTVTNLKRGGNVVDVLWWGVRAYCPPLDLRRREERDRRAD